MSSKGVTNSKEIVMVFAMAAVFTAVVRAPVTASVLIMEMTGSFEHPLPVIIVCMVGYVVSDLAKTRSVYEDLYELSLKEEADGGPGYVNHSGGPQAIKREKATDSHCDDKNKDPGKKPPAGSYAEQSWSR